MGTVSSSLASFRDGERAWSRISIEERRALLSLTIARVELMPWPGGTSRSASLRAGGSFGSGGHLRPRIGPRQCS